MPLVAEPANNQSQRHRRLLAPPTQVNVIGRRLRSERHWPRNLLTKYLSKNRLAAPPSAAKPTNDLLFLAILIIDYE